MSSQVVVKLYTTKTITIKILTGTPGESGEDGADSTVPGPPGDDANLLAIKAMEWDVGVLSAVTTALTMNSDDNGEFTATLPLTGTTTTISLTNLPTEKNRWPVLHLVTGATFDEPIWTNIYGVDINAVLVASSCHTIGFKPMWDGTLWHVVAIDMGVKTVAELNA
jgi:hypothetical protein